jgi:O-antigen ligase
MFFGLLTIYIALAVRILNKTKLQRFNAIEYLFMLSLIFAIPSSLIYSDLEEYIKILLIPFVLYYACSNYSVSPSFLKKVLYITLISFILVALLLVLQVGYRVFDFNIVNVLQRNRFAGYFLVSDVPLGPNVFSISLSVVAITAYSISFIYNGIRNYFFIGIMLIAIFLIMVVASRTVSVALIFILAINQLLTDTGNWQIKKILNKLPIAAVLLILFLPVVFSYLPESFFERYAVITNFSADGSLLTRFRLWDGAFGMLLDNPIFGVGYSKMVNVYGMTTHNEFLAHFVAGGFFTGLFMLTLYIIIVRSIFINTNKISKESMFFVRFSMSIFFLTMFIGLTENYSFSYSALYYPIIWVYFGLFRSLVRDSAKALPVKQNNEVA